MTAPEDPAERALDQLLAGLATISVVLPTASALGPAPLGAAAAPA